MSCIISIILVIGLVLIIVKILDGANRCPLGGNHIWFKLWHDGNHTLYICKKCSKSDVRYEIF